MNDNLPLGAANRIDAPWNIEDDNKFELAITSARETLAETIPDLLWETLEDAPYSVKQEVYDELYDKAKELWETGV